MANVPAPVTKAMDAVRGFTLAQRTIALIGIAVLVLGTIALVTFMSQPKMTPLFTGLAPEDAAGVVEQLKADSVPYELTGGGGTILVPEANVYDSRLKAAAAGLPSAGTSGYSLLDDMGVTSSEFQQSVTYKRALEGELATTIQAMDGIKLASVKLAIPEQTVFVDSKTNPTASIFVETKPNVTLGSDQVQSIVHLTSAAVDGLKAEDISVVDSTGKLLSAAGVGVTGGAEKQAADYETRVAGVIQAMLDRVVGPGNATVAVAADLSLESAERTEESFTNPEGKPALDRVGQGRKLCGHRRAPAQGCWARTTSRCPAAPTARERSIPTDNQRTNAVNKVTENRQIPSGTLNRQSVSVALDSAAAQGLEHPRHHPDGQHRCRHRRGTQRHRQRLGRAVQCRRGRCRAGCAGSCRGCRGGSPHRGAAAHPDHCRGHRPGTDPGRRLRAVCAAQQAKPRTRRPGRVPRLHPASAGTGRGRAP